MRQPVPKEVALFLFEEHDWVVGVKMFKHTFITLTVSLVVLGLLSVFQPQVPSNIAPTQQENVALQAETNTNLFKEDILIVNMDKIERKVKIQEVAPEVEVQPEAITTPVVVETKKEVKPAVKAPTKTVAKKEVKTEAKAPVATSPKAEAKPVETAQPKEEVKAETTGQTTEQPKEEVKPAPVVSKVSTSPAATWEKEIARLTNIEREKAGLSILSYNTSLEAGAQIRAAEIIENFSHTRPDGSRFFTAFGNLQYKNIGENLGSGFRTPEAVVNAWMNSASHKANILKPEYQEISVAITKDADGKYRWVQIFYRGR